MILKAAFIVFILQKRNSTMLSKFITVFFAVNVIPAVNGYIDSKLRVVEPILKCYKGNAPEFSGEKALVAHLNPDSDADFIKWSCLATEVSLQTKLMQDKLNKDILKWD